MSKWAGQDTCKTINISVSLKGRFDTIKILQSELSSHNIEIYGDMFKKIASNGVYVSGSSSFFNMSGFDFYSNIRLVSAANPPFRGYPVEDYEIISAEVLNIRLPSNLPIGKYEIIFCNEAGYTTSRKQNKLPLIEVFST
jgi:hypothetical protein